MTEETTGASAPSTTSSSDSIIAAAKASQASSASQTVAIDPTSSQPTAEVVVSASAASDPQTAMASDIERLFARVSSLEQSIHPRLEAVEDAIESLAKRAGDAASPEIAKELAELQVAVHSLGGAVIGHTGHDSGAFFHSWWKKLKGEMDPPAPSAPVASPLAAGGAPIPLAK
jgi:hypothetical protein